MRIMTILKTKYTNKTRIFYTFKPRLEPSIFIDLPLLRISND